MKVSNILIAKIKGFEGCKLQSYQDSVGVWTIGVGHTKGVMKGQIINAKQADLYLQSDLVPVESYINSLPHKFTQGEFDALADFAFNLGIDALRKSTLIRKVLQGSNDSDIQAEFNKWTHAGGQVLRGLVTRRAWEATRWKQN